MPNIEIHGLNLGTAGDLSRQIATLFKDVSYRKDIVVTIPYADMVHDLDNNLRPFLRAIFAENEPAGVYDDCLEVLAELNMDTEVVVIRAFIPKKE